MTKFMDILHRFLDPSWWTEWIKDDFGITANERHWHCDTVGNTTNTPSQFLDPELHVQSEATGLEDGYSPHLFDPTLTIDLEFQWIEETHSDSSPKDPYPSDGVSTTTPSTLHSHGSSTTGSKGSTGPSSPTNSTTFSASSKSSSAPKGIERIWDDVVDVKEDGKTTHVPCPEGLSAGKSVYPMRVILHFR
ncbi:hypothetical protein BCR34DRAFT_604478 [Clohesyomyces aquaticus]|uniref:Uncharacterized protein n=1 Tax=Clohesyomyces aquaticus TaxID=1231657 RepID=A0A1Y1Z600_9PLEO|nr:hypothetical protein BCR34DRAFT_604478 [Clohesyomyces aquaticus]